MKSFIVRFPDGEKEFRYTESDLMEGNLVWHEGARYRVLSVASEDGQMRVVTVEPDSDDLGDLLKSERGAVALELIPVG
jgi:hypothetical protein